MSVTIYTNRLKLGGTVEHDVTLICLSKRLVQRMTSLSVVDHDVNRTQSQFDPDLTIDFVYNDIQRLNQGSFMTEKTTWFKI